MAAKSTGEIHNLKNLIAERTDELEKALKNEKTVASELRRSKERLEFLTHISEILTSTLDYCEVLSNLAKKVTPVIADWCVIYEITPSGDLNRLAISHCNPEKINTVLKLTEKYPPESITGYGVYKVVRTGEPLLLHNIDEADINQIAVDEEHLKLMQEVGFKSSLLIPMFMRDELFGIMILVSSQENRPFVKRDIDFVKEIARRAMLAIENARLYEEAKKTNAILEVKVSERTRELEAINKELEAFSYSVSHDLRAPLRSIDGFSSKILTEYEVMLDEKGKDYFRRVINASHHMGELIDDMLKLSRLSRVELRLESTDLSAIAESIALDLRISDPDRKSEIKIKPGMLVVADKNLMKIALYNLLENAWKYSRKKEITCIEFSYTYRNKRLVYYVKDNGIGFDMKYADKLFGSFQRLHNASEYEGTGVGLATVKRIIYRHKGEIWAESQVNEGTTFYFTL